MFVKSVAKINILFLPLSLLKESKILSTFFYWWVFSTPSNFRRQNNNDVVLHRRTTMTLFFIDKVRYLCAIGLSS